MIFMDSDAEPLIQRVQQRVSDFGPCMHLPYSVSWIVSRTLAVSAAMCHILRQICLRKSDERDSHIRSLSAPPIQKHLAFSAACAHVCLHRGWQKLTSVRSPLFHASREEEFDEYFEDMFLWLPPSAAWHPAVTTLSSPLTLSAFPSLGKCFPLFFPHLLFVLSLSVFKCRGRNKANVYRVASLF